MISRSLLALAVLASSGFAQDFRATPFLNPGIYNLEASAPGFTTTRHESIALLTADKLNIHSPGPEYHFHQPAIRHAAANPEQLSEADTTGGQVYVLMKEHR